MSQQTLSENGRAREAHLHNKYNRHSSQVAKKSRIPVPVARHPLRSVQPHSVMTSATKLVTTPLPNKPLRPSSAVKEVPDFKKLHRQWQRKLEQAKENRRDAQCLSWSLSKPPGTSLTVSKKPDRRAPTKNLGVDSNSKIRFVPEKNQRVCLVDNLLARMALSTSNAIHRMSRTEQNHCSPVRANLDQQFTEVQDDQSQSQSAKQMTTKSEIFVSKSSKLTECDSQEPLPQSEGIRSDIIHLVLTSRPLRDSPIVFNFYESEPELNELFTQHSNTASKWCSGRRNPVGLTLATINMDSHFLPISSH